jgi:glycosyltransferase involved in cell wall biosynthesis
MHINENPKPEPRADVARPGHGGGAERLVRVAICYRACQFWRLPVFRRLSRVQGIELTVFHSRGVKGTKIVNAPDDGTVNRVAMWTLSGATGLTGRNVRWLVCPGLLMQLARHRPDVILLEGASNLPTCILAIAYAKLANVPWAWWSLGELKGRRYSLLGRMYRRLVAAIERQADAVIAYSSQGADYFRGIGVEPSRIWTAVNVVDTAAILAARPDFPAMRRVTRRELGLDEAPVVLFCGALTGPKRVDRLVPVMARVRHEVPSARMVVVGDGPARAALEAAVKDAGLAGCFAFCGDRPGDAGRFMCAADVLVLPGLGGLVISEAMAYGLPVVCTTADGTEEDLIGSAERGYLVRDTGSEDEIVSGIGEGVARLLLDDPLRMKAGAAAQRAIEDRFNIDQYVAQLSQCVAAMRRSRAGCT